MATSSFNINELVASHGDKGLLATALVDKTAHEQLEEQLQHQRRGLKVYIRNVLDVKDSEVIRTRYGGKYDLHLTQQELAPHGLAGALRLCETLDCLDFFPRSGLRQDLVLDFGGSWVTHYLRGHNVHCCSPCLGIRDKMRHAERLMSMRKVILNDPQQFDGRQPDFCTKSAAECKVQAHFAISIHGGYDMGFRGLCEAMNAHGTTILKGTMMFDGAMMFDDQGFIPELKCQWRKIKSAFSEEEDATCLAAKLNSTVFSRVRNGKTLIAFDFVEESTMSYVHDWDNIKSFMTDQTYSFNGMTYGIERCVIYAGVMTYKIVGVPGMCPPELIRHCIWFPSMKDYVGLKIPASDDLVKWKTVRILLSTLRETEEIAMRCYNDKKNWMDQFKIILGVLSSKSSTIVINGMSMQSGERIDLNDYHYIGFAILLHTKLKYEQLGKMYDMWNASFIWKWFASMSRPFRVFFSTVVKTLFPTLRPREEKEFLVKLSTFVTFNEECSFDGGKEWDVISSAAFVAAQAVADGTILAEEKAKKLADRLAVPVEEEVSAIPEVSPAPADQGNACGLETETSELDSLSAQTRSPITRIAERATAMLEYSAYEKQLHDTTVSNLQRIWCMAGGDNKRNSLESNLKFVFDTYFSVDALVNVHFPTGRWMHPVPEGVVYSVGYNEKGLGPKLDSELYIVNGDCVISNSHDLFSITKSLLAPTGTISQVDGVAGCGKTTAIKSMFNPSTDIIVTANKKSAQDVRYALFKSTDSKEACAFVRTADSILLNDCPTVSRVLVDEVVLLHFGQLCAVMSKLHAVRALCFGDSEQIAFSSRDASFDMRFSKLIPDETSDADTTFRSPQDVVPLVRLMATKALPKGTRTKYSKWVSQSKVRKSVTSRAVASVSLVELDPTRFYITMTQADKASLITRAKELNLPKAFYTDRIKTVHESQGISEDHVTLVRLKSTKCDLFKKFSYCLVAVTRHKVTFRYEYCGVLGGDLIASCIPLV
ncbi:1a protein [Cucumber mosaic virus]|uniref:Replication protein 1a n=1 Tax=Cucumber mosaic virus TaxID=12305 RepID=A0A172PC49_9BROM|nr:1a protein [Cucumber mosaic virus]